MIIDMTEKARDSRARREAQKQGFILRKSKARNWTVDNQQGYMILNGYSGGVLGGSRFDMSLDDVEIWLKQ